MPNLPLQAAPVVATVMGGAAVLVAGNAVQLIINNGKTVVDVTVKGVSLIDTERQNKSTAKREQKHCKNWEDILDNYNSRTQNSSFLKETSE